MKNILFINHTFYVHGAETVMLQIIEQVFDKTERQNVYVLEPKGDNNSIFKKELDKLGVDKYLSLPYKYPGGSFFYSLPVLFFKVVYTTFKLISYVKKNKIDIIYSNTSTTIVGIITAIFTRKTHIWHFHEQITSFRHWSDLLNIFYRIFLLYKRNITIFISETQKKQWKDKLQLSFTKSKIIYNPVKKIDVLPRKPLHSNIFFGYIGSWSKIKNIPFLLKCFARLLSQYPDVKLILTANIGDDKEQIVECMKTLDLSERVIIKQYDSVSEFYSEIDILVLPSLSETFPLVFLEAVSVKKPVIITNNTGLHELFEDGKDCLFINPLKQNSLLEAMKKMINVDFREKMGRNGYDKLNSYDFNSKFVSEFNVLLK